MNVVRKQDYLSPLQSNPVPRPFVKWAGGKGQLLPDLLSRLPEHIAGYHEPFLGGGALFFALQPQRAILSDTNSDLIDTYSVVRDAVGDLIRSLKAHRYDRDYFYEIRNIDREARYRRWGKTRRASRFIFLNKSCYNGLYRVNSQGHFNVPFGLYHNPTIVDRENLQACSKALQSVRLKVQSFERVVEQARPGDFVYFDPPYAPLSSTSNFTAYSKDGFGTEQQEKLRDVCVELNRRGIFFMLSNSSSPLILELYKRREFNLELVEATRAINSNAARRGKIAEVIVRNYGRRSRGKTLRSTGF